MPSVTKEQIERARQCNVLDYALMYESNNIKRVGNAYRMKDHPSIEIKSGKWRWYSRGLYGRTALDFLTNVRGYGLVDAVCMLLNEEPIGSTKSAKHTPNSIVSDKSTPKTPTHTHFSEPLPFTLPRHNKDNRRVIAYLQSRGIDKQIILDAISNGSLYERAMSHDCVFVGRNEQGKICYAAMRSTSSNFKRDADGSNKKYSFLLPPNKSDSISIAAFEAPIDALSHQSLCKNRLIPPFDGWRISLGGTSILALEQFLKQNKNVTHCVVCTDNDEAGERVAARIKNLDGITIERSPPLVGSDWNDTLQVMLKEKRLTNGQLGLDR